MIIYKNTFDKIIKNCSNTFAESGGILGGQEGIIKQFKFDEGIGEKSIGEYVPNVNMLNRYIACWQKENIDFLGIVHTHFQKIYKLSCGDIKYIKKILLNMPTEITYLYFPLYFPLDKKMFSFKAIRNDNDIAVVKDIIKII